MAVALGEQRLLLLVQAREHQVVRESQVVPERQVAVNLVSRPEVRVAGEVLAQMAKRRRLLRRCCQSKVAKQRWSDWASLDSS